MFKQVNSDCLDSHGLWIPGLRLSGFVYIKLFQHLLSIRVTMV